MVLPPAGPSERSRVRPYANAMTHPDPALDVTHALEAVNIPAFVVDRQGRVRWQNRGAIAMGGNRVGEPFSRLVAPEDLDRARTSFARKLIGEASTTEYELTVIGRDGRRVRVRASTVPFVENGEVTGIFGLAYPLDPAVEGGESTRIRQELPSLTARQYQALVLLAEGLGTGQIAARLGVADETARNHIRGLLRQLDVHSRLEAVVVGHKLGLLPGTGD